MDKHFRKHSNSEHSHHKVDDYYNESSTHKSQHSTHQHSKHRHHHNYYHHKHNHYGHHHHRLLNEHHSRRRRSHAVSKYYKPLHSRHKDYKHKHHNHHHHHHHYHYHKHSKTRSRDNHLQHNSNSHSQDSYYRYNSSYQHKDIKHKQTPSSSISPSSKSSRKFDKGHYEYSIGEIIANKYEIIRCLGEGTFGRVLECKNIMDRNCLYAAKIIRPVTRYIESAQIEVKVIQDIQQSDTYNQSNCIKLIEAFSFVKDNDTYYAMIFEKAGLSLFKFIEKNNYRGYSISQIQHIAKQLFIGIGYLHNKQIIHTDLKPENILFIDSDYDIIANINSCPSNVIHKENMTGETTSNDDTHYNYLKVKNTSIKIIDFGGAVYTSDSCNGTINTRQYRSPEVIMNTCRFDTKSDLWSLGCILMELYTGELLFATHDDEEHLCLIEKVCGKYPQWMVDKCVYSLQKIFNMKYNTIDYDLLRNESKVKKALDLQYNIDELVLKEHKEFSDLIKKILVIDPKNRMSCEEALQHEFFNKKYKE